MRRAKGLAGIAFALALAAPAFAQDQQLGARTKAMGGSYTAFEDDPVLVWLNPAGIASQPDQVAVAYQTYTAYPKGRQLKGGVAVDTVKPETVLSDPAFWPSYLGVVFQAGTPERPMAVGLCMAQPYVLNFSMDQVDDPAQTVFVPEAEMKQSLSRFRAAAAMDFPLSPRGQPGFLTHVAAGLAIDVGYEQWKFTSADEDLSDTSSGLGGGLGMLLGLYDDTESFKVNVGVAFQSMVRYEFKFDPDLLPSFHMPRQVNAGITFYLLQGMPLRFTADVQFIHWSAAAEEPAYPRFNGIDDAVSFSLGAEYKMEIGERVRLYPRVGYRRFDAPWSDKDDLPMTGTYRLVLDTEADAFSLVTFGLGLGWTSDAGKVRSVDVAGEMGGDSYNWALGVTFEF